MIFWALVKDDIYSVKEGYKILQHNTVNKPISRAFSFYWNSVVLPKAGCFSWLALKHMILTSDRLNRLKFLPLSNVFFVGNMRKIWTISLSHALFLTTAGILFCVN